MVMKTLCLFLVIIMLIPFIFGCGYGVDTPGAEQGNGESTKMEPVEEETTSKVDMQRVIARNGVLFSDLGLKVSSFTSSNEEMVDIELMNNKVFAYIYQPGTTEVAVSDCFGHTASYTLTVTEDLQVKVDIKPCEEKFLEVSQFGAKADNTTDDSAAFQAAIDAAKPGETVYVYPGLYYVTFIRMREGITLKMQTTMTDATTGYNADIIRAVAYKKMAVLRGVRIMNNDNKQHGSEGSSNFTVSGGVLDMDKSTRGAVIFGCADNVRLENIIFKNIKNNHAIQFTGCTNSSIVNCMFAGYVMDSVFTREVVQIEPSTPGATGSVSNGNIPPLRFYEGEYYLPENITIERCYFGKSDTEGAPLMAIGHHSQVGKSNVTGFKIINNVFDECLYAAIRYNNISDVEITGNTFISTAAVKNTTGMEDAKTPAFIVLYHNTGRKRYTNVVDNTSVTEAEACEQAGIHRLKIKDNVFRIGAGSDKMVLYYPALATHAPGATYQSKEILRQEAYNDPTYRYSGYLVHSNYGSHVDFSENEIYIEGQPTYSNYYLFVTGVYDLNVSDNRVNMATGVSFTDSYGNLQGLHLASNHEASVARTYVVHAANTDKTVTVRYANTIMTTIVTQEDITLTLRAAEGGDLSLSADRNGNLYVDIICEEGYRFDAMTKENGNAVGEKIALSESDVLTFSFEKK